MRSSLPPTPADRAGVRSDAPFLESPAGDEEQRIVERIRAYDGAQAAKLQQELFTQRKRLADAERALQTKPTKKAADDQRIATDKIERAKVKLDDLARTELTPRDTRIFPGWYAPVLIVENGQRVIKPMRYLCRPAGKPASYCRFHR